MAVPIDTSTVPPPEEKAAAVQDMFGAIAPRYDLLNHLLSLNLDRVWRRRAVDCMLADFPADGLYLDACAGTLDLAVELAGRGQFRGLVVASDFTFAMLEHGRRKMTGLPIVSACADALTLPFADRLFDGVTVGFGVRNLAHLDAGLTELVRVLRPGGKLVILEFTTPAWRPFRSVYLFYFRRVLPLIGKLISRHRSAYEYLPASVLAFPEPPALAAHMERTGLEAVGWSRLTGGIVAIHSGTKPGSITSS